MPEQPGVSLAGLVQHGLADVEADGSEAFAALGQLAQWELGVNLLPR